MSRLLELRLEDIVEDDRTRVEYGDLDGMAESVKEFGILVPITVDENSVLVDGGRRVRVARTLGMDSIPAYVVPVAEAADRKRMEIETTERRKGWTTTEKLAAAAAVKRLIAAGTKAVPAGTTHRDYVAAVTGFDSGGTMERAQQVMRHGSPALKDAVDKGAVSVGAAAELLTLPKTEQEQVVKSGTAKVKAAEVRKAKGTAKGKGKAEPVKQEKPAAADNTEQLDGLGNVVPNCVADALFDPALVSVVAMIEEQGGSLRSLLAAVKDVTKKGDAWPFAHFGKSQVSLSDAIDKLKDAHGQLSAGLPFCVCQNCKGNGCPLCGSAGYLTRHMYENPGQYGGD